MGNTTTADDLSDGELLTGLYWSTYFSQHTEPAGAQWSPTITEGAHATDCYMEDAFEFRDGYEQLSPDSLHAPAAPVDQATAATMHVSTGESQAEPPPFEVSTPYLDALHFRVQAEALHREEIQLLGKRASPSPKRKRTIEEYYSSLARSINETGRN